MPGSFEQLPLALAPDQPASVTVTAPRGESALRDGVEGDLGLVFAILGAVMLVAAAVGIANVTTLSVMQRTGEIGLRRALGARASHIAAQFLTESVIVGMLGGLIGTAVGVFSVAIVAVAQGWAVSYDPWLIVAGPLVGVLVGALAGGLPARRAARIAPVEALRGD